MKLFKSNSKLIKIISAAALAAALFSIPNTSFANWHSYHYINRPGYHVRVYSWGGGHRWWWRARHAPAYRTWPAYRCSRVCNGWGCHRRCW